MKKILFFALLLCFTNAIGQITLESNQKNYCSKEADDTINCLRSPVKTIFYIDIVQNRIFQQDDSQKIAFIIDSKSIADKETIIYKIHTATGERLNFIVSEYLIKIQSLVYKDQYTEFEL